MVVTNGLLGKTIQQLGRMKKAADLIKLRKDTAHLGPGHYRDIAREIGPDIHDQLINDALDIYGKFQQTYIGALLPFDNGKEGNVMKKKNDFYTWLDQIANKKAQEWTQVPMKPLSTDEVYADMLNDPTYNYKTFYDLQPFMAERMLTADPNAHFTDIGKTMYHPTFSNESAYSGYVVIIILTEQLEVVGMKKVLNIHLVCLSQLTIGIIIEPEIIQIIQKIIL